LAVRLRGRSRRADSRRRSPEGPIVHALRGKEFIEHDNPYDVGMTGLLGFSSGYHAMMDCDALVMLGTDFRISSSIRRMRSRAG